MPRGCFRQLDELVRLGVAADFVFEAARQPQGPFAHRLIDERRHPRDLVRAGRALEVVAHHQTPHRRVTGERGDVDRSGAAPAFRQIVADWPRRPAIRPDHDGRDALRHLRRSLRVARQFIG